MFSLLKKNTAFFIPYLLFLLIGGIILIVYSKVDIALFINGYHCNAADFFFQYWTGIGLGYLVIPVTLFLAFKSMRYAIMSLITFILTVSINNSIKFWARLPRPEIVFQGMHKQIYYVPGVDIYSSNSFPSGHSAISFGLFCLLALTMQKPLHKFLMFMIAFLVAYSRMYLAEHFLMDVYAASVIGIVCTLVTFTLVTNWKWLNKFAATDKPLLRL